MDLTKYFNRYLGRAIETPMNDLEKDFAEYAPLTRESLEFLYNVLLTGAIDHTDTRKYLDDCEKRQMKWDLKAAGGPSLQECRQISECTDTDDLSDKEIN